MKHYLIVPVLAFLINFSTIPYAIALNIRNPVNRTYVMLAAAISMWVFCSAAFHISLDDTAIAPFSKFSSIFWFSTGFFFMNFTYVFLRRRRDIFYYFILGISALTVLISTNTDLIVNGYSHYHWGWRFTEGPLFNAATVLAIITPIMISWGLAFRYRSRTEDPVRRSQLTPLLSGTIIALLFSAVNQFVIPRLPGLENIVRYTASWSVILSLFVFYTIIRYRFLTPGINTIAMELFSSSVEGVVILDNTGTVLHINRAALGILSIDNADTSSLRMETLIDGYRGDAVYSNYQTTAGPREKRTVLLSQSDIRSGVITTGKILIINDITAMARMNEALRESNELFGLIANNVTDVIWIYDLATAKFSYVSPSCTASTGWTPEEYTRLSLPDILDEEDVNQVTRLLTSEIDRDGVRYPGRSRSLTLKERTKNGGLVHIEVKASFIRDTSGKPTAVLGVTRDITEFKRLERELRSSLEALKERNDTIENDLKTAQIIQRALLPAGPPRCDRLAIDFRYLPLEAVGGDFFNILPLSDGGLSIFLSDVTGHGISAALFLSLLKTISSAHLRRHAYQPSEFLASVNADLFEHMHSCFLSAVYGIFKVNKGKKAVNLAVACGGHPPPIAHYAGAESANYLDIRGAMIGVASDNSFPQLEMDLNPGDRMFFYTDGLPEIIDEQRNYLGYDRFLDIVGRTRVLPLGEALDTIMAAIDHFRGSGKITDDMVIIGVDVL
ncbi:MAG TPA: SpoIIE family protein phosphatase [Spirochaetota bacterium]|nr:SpoIIE family protein phosphatase [Spirochaetota bacterium]